jgi:hypothetical protein
MVTLKFELASTTTLIKINKLTSLFLFKDLFSNRFQLCELTFRVVNMVLGATVQFVAGDVSKLKSASRANHFFIR